MTNVHFYFRHPGNIYFSIEKLFGRIAEKINQTAPHRFHIDLLNLPLPTSLLNIWDNISYARNTQTSINHITGDIHYAILGCNQKNINILTIHDCVMLRRLSRTNPKFWIIKWLWYDLPVRKADIITVISEHTKKELIHFTGCSEKRIRVIGNFYDEQMTTVPHSFNKNEPVILFIGTAINKNLPALIKAVAGMKIRLHIVGSPSSGDLQDLKTNNILYRVSSGISEEEMRQAYIQCDLLAFPSTYEGFGLPILEAQMTGRAVLTSNISPMKEVAGDAAVLVDPNNVSSIREGVSKIINDDFFRENMVNAGFENVKRFTLAEVTRQYASLYEELLIKKPISAN